MFINTFHLIDKVKIKEFSRDQALQVQGTTYGKNKSMTAQHIQIFAYLFFIVGVHARRPLKTGTNQGQQKHWKGTIKEDCCRQPEPFSTSPSLAYPHTLQISTQALTLSSNSLSCSPKQIRPCQSPFFPRLLSTLPLQHISHYPTIM